VVAELTEQNRSSTRPDAVDVLPVEVVEQLMARHEEELDALRLELDAARRDADVAEARLSRHPAATVYDDTFEAKVLAHLARSIAHLDTEPDSDAESGTKTGGPAWVTPIVTSPPGDPKPPVISPPPPIPPPPPPAPATAPPPATPLPPPPVPPPPPAAVPAVSQTPRVEASLTTEAHREEPADADGGGPVRRGSGGAVTRRRGASKAHARRAPRIPALLLIQVGVAVVVVALLLLKLG
jgi:hypothetical protein